MTATWKTKAERGSALLIRLIAWLARSAGRPLCRALLYPIVLYFVLTDAVARRSSREFLGVALGRRAGFADVFAHLHCFACTLLDRVYMANGQFHRFQVSIEGDALVRAAAQSGKGCMLLGSHLGSFDLMLLGGQALGDQAITVLMHVDPRSRVRNIAGIDDAKLRIIPLGQPDSYLRAYEVLEQGGIVAALADRADATNHLQADFLGRAAHFPLAPHVLAARAGALVLMCFGLYEGGANYRVVFTEFGAAAPPGSKGAALQAVVNRYAEVLEHWARRHPYNWFNFFPYWAAP